MDLAFLEEPSEVLGIVRPLQCSLHPASYLDSIIPFLGLPFLPIELLGVRKHPRLQ